MKRFNMIDEEFICEHCGKETQIKRFERPNRIPLYSSEEILTKVFV